MRSRLDISGSGTMDPPADRIVDPPTVAAHQDKKARVDDPKSDGNKASVPADVVEIVSEEEAAEKETPYNISIEGIKKRIQSKELVSLLELAREEVNQTEAYESTMVEDLEMNEWSLQLAQLPEIKPSPQLETFLRAGDRTMMAWVNRILPSLNKALLKMGQASQVDKKNRSASVQVEKSGIVQVSGEMTPDKQWAAVTIALYYHSLESVLCMKSAQLKTTKHPDVVLNTEINRGLLACSCLCTARAFGVTLKLSRSPHMQTSLIGDVLDMAESNSFDFIKVADDFIQAQTCETPPSFQSLLVFRLPQMLASYLHDTQASLSESLLWKQLGSAMPSFPSTVDEFEAKTKSGRTTLWPPQALAPTLREEIGNTSEDREKQDGSQPLVFPIKDHQDYSDYQWVQRIVLKVLRIALRRLQDMCEVLRVPAELATQSWVAFRYLMRHRVEAFYDRHIDQIILCCLYAVAKAFEIKLTFHRIIDGYIELRGPELGVPTCRNIVKKVKMYDERSGPAHIITMYNEIFVTLMGSYLDESEYLRKGKHSASN